jgi:predicted phage gp36 major capsid-like protein
MAKTKKAEIKEALETGVIHDAPAQAEETTEQTTTAQTEETKTKKIKILKVVCRPEGTFLPGRIYEIDSKLADKLIASGNAKEEQ